MAKGVRIAAGIIITLVSFIALALDFQWGVTLGYSFATPQMGILLAIILVGLMISGILMIIDGGTSDKF